MCTHHCFVLICYLGTALPTPANDLFTPAELSDQELSQLHGHYMPPGQIVSFGVTMSSTWQNTSSQVLGARVDLQVRRNLVHPVLNVTLVDRSDDTPSPVTGSDWVLGGAGLAQTQEVNQGIHTADDHDSADNGVDVEVRHGEAPLPPLGGTSPEGALVLSGEAGTMEATLNDGAPQLAIQASGQGTSLQGLGAGGLVQNMVLSRNRNLVQSLAAFEVMLEDRPGVDPAPNCAWEQLRALRPSGYQKLIWSEITVPSEGRENGAANMTQTLSLRATLYATTLVSPSLAQVVTESEVEALGKEPPELRQHYEV